MPDGAHKKKEEGDSMYTEYKGYYIETDFYGQGECTVQFCGDDILFDSPEEAKEFIDSLEQ